MVSQNHRVAPKRLHVKCPINLWIELIPQLDFLWSALHFVSSKRAHKFRMEDSFVQSVLVTVKPEWLLYFWQRFFSKGEKKVFSLLADLNAAKYFRRLWDKKPAGVNTGYNYHHRSSLWIHTFYIPFKTEKNPRWDVFQWTNLANEMNINDCC